MVTNADLAYWTLKAVDVAYIEQAIIQANYEQLAYEIVRTSVR